MTKAEIEKNPYIEFTDIGQGRGYKADWNTAALDDVVYVPEYGIVEDDDGKEFADAYYTKQDFINLAGSEWLGFILHQGVDWQFPETLIDEGYLDDPELRYDDIKRVLDENIPIKEKAKALLKYYYETPDRSDKEFDTLDMCLDLLQEYVEEK